MDVGVFADQSGVGFPDSLTTIMSAWQNNAVDMSRLLQHTAASSGRFLGLGMECLAEESHAQLLC